jgi:undecaprenyl-diphosphatase
MWDRSTVINGIVYWCGVELLLLLFGRLTALPSLFDLHIQARLAETRSEFIDEFFRTITWAGSLYLLFPATAAAVVWMVKKGWRLDAWRLGLSLFGVVAGVYLAKEIGAKPRPSLWPVLIPGPSSFSFPSAHTAQIVAVTAAICFIRPSCRNHYRWFLLIILGILLASAVGISRMYLQAHYLSDVVGGAGYAVCWVLALESLLRRPSEDSPRNCITG